MGGVAQLELVGTLEAAAMPSSAPEACRRVVEVLGPLDLRIIFLEGQGERFLLQQVEIGDTCSLAK